MPNSYEVDLTGADPFEVTALVISIWACPEDKDQAFRERLYLSLCGIFIRCRAARDPLWAQQPQLITPSQACRSTDEIRRDMRTFDRRIKQRAIAGDIVIPFLKEAAAGTVPELPPGVRRLSLNQMLEYALPRHDIASIANLRSRAWRPSQRVLHLCAAWVMLAQEHFSEHGSNLDALRDFQRGDFLVQFLRRAQEMEQLIEQSRLKISAEELITFRLVNEGGS